MRLSSCVVSFYFKHIELRFQVSVLSWDGWVGDGGGQVKSKLKLNSAKAEAKASSSGLAELGKIYQLKLL